MPLIVAIDGPAGSGKSTTARAVAQSLGYLYLNTGAMYRALALGASRQAPSLTEADVAQVLPSLQVDVILQNGTLNVLLNGEDVTRQLQTPEVGQAASRIATFGAVRDKLVAAQQRIGQASVRIGQGVVLEGRDIGTVVFPDADLKVFMDADLAERARRRWQELKTRGKTASLAEVEAEIARRDEQDRSRALAPLRQAADAILLDTTAMTIDDQVAAIVKLVREREKMSAV